MAEIWTLRCREHGGEFRIAARRGRPPVKCSPENACTAAGKMSSERSALEALSPTHQKVSRRTVGSSRKAQEAPEVPTYSVDHSKAPRGSRKARKTQAEQVTEEVAKLQPERTQEDPRSNPGRQACIREAQRIREVLEAQGWQVTGKVLGQNGAGQVLAAVTAARGEELLSISITNGKVTNEQYSLWNVDKPSANGKPKSNLPFDPDEVTDAELAQLITGAKVTWWNKLGSKEETAYCGKDKIKISHLWTGTGEEVPSARVISFVDPENAGFRDFRLDALMKVGR